MTTATEIKSLFAAIETAEAAYDAALEALETDAENAALEAAWDEAYRVLWNAEQAFAVALESFTAGFVSEKTARRMLTIKRDELTELVHRLAA